MPKSLSRSRNITILFSTVAILAIASFLYFYLYIQNREETLHARNSRVLDQICQNILALNETYLKNAQNNANQDIPALESEATALLNNRKIEGYNQEIRDKVAETILKPFLDLSPDTLGLQFQHFETLRDTLNARLKKITFLPPLEGGKIKLRAEKEAFEIDQCEDWKEAIEKGPGLTEKIRALIPANFSFDGFAVPVIEEGDIQALTDEKAEQVCSEPISFAYFQEEYQKKINLNYEIVSGTGQSKGAELQETGQSWNIVYADEVKDTDSLWVKLTRPVSELMSKVKREDVFDELVVIRRSPKPDSAGNGFSSIYQTLEDNFISRELLQQVDSLLKQQLETDRRHTIPKIPYQIYVKPLQLPKEKDLYVCGLISAQRFNVEKAQVPATLILFLVIIAVLLVLSIPFLKLRLLGKYERVGIRDVVFSLAAFIMGTWLLVLLLVNGYRVYVQDEADRKKQLEALHDEISASFFTELDSIYRQLGFYDEYRYNRGLANDRLNVLADLKDPLYPRSYPYFNTVLWSTPEDKLGREISPNNTPTLKIEITGRQYLERLKNDQPWKLGGSDPDAGFMLESILTRTTGDQLAAVSRKSRSPEKNPIVFLSSNLYSVIRPVLPQNYGFAIIDQEGLVLFHSDQSRNLQENFFEECDNRNFRSAIFSRSQLHVSGNYLGIDHKFFIKPLKTLPLFLITFENKTFYRLAHSQVLSFNFLLSLIFLFFGVIFLGLLFLLSPEGKSLKHQYFLLEWLKPSEVNTGSYRKLILINLGILAALIVAGRTDDPATNISLIILSNFYAFVLAFLHLNLNTYKEFVWEKYWQHLAALSVIFLLVHSFLFLGLQPLYKGRILLFEVFPIGLVLIRFFRLTPELGDRSPVQTDQAESQPLPAEQTRPKASEPSLAAAPFSGLMKSLTDFLDTRRSYRFFFLSWLTISSVFPGIKFYEISYNYEQGLLAQWTQIELAKDLEARNHWIESRYRQWRTDPASSVKQELKQKGIYTAPYRNTLVNSYADWNISLQPDLAVIRDTIQAIRREQRNDSLSTLTDVSRGVLEIKNAGAILARLNISSTDRSWQMAVDSAGELHLWGDSLIFQLREAAGNIPAEKKLIFKEPEFDKEEKDPEKIIRRNKTIAWKTRRRDPAVNNDLYYGLFNDSLKLTYSLRLDGLPEVSGSLPVTLQPYLPGLVRRTGEKERKTDSKKFEKASLLEILALLRPRFNETVRQTNRFVEQESANGLWFWRKNGQMLQYFNLGQQLSISSELRRYTFPGPPDQVLKYSFFWIAFIVIAYFIYRLLDFQVRNLFAQDIQDKGYLPLHSNKNRLLNTEDNVFLVVPSAPISSDFMSVLRSKARNKNADLKDLMIDLNDDKPIPAAKAGDPWIENLKNSPFLVLNHFDHNIEDPETCNRRFQFLRLLKNKELFGKKQLILISNRPNFNIERLLEKNAKKNNGDRSGSDPELLVDKKEVQQLLVGFRTIFYPPDRWSRALQPKEFQQLAGVRPAYFQIAPKRYEAIVEAREGKTTLHDYSLKDSGDFIEWTSDKAPEPAGDFILLDHDEDLGGFKEKLKLLEERIYRKKSAKDGKNIHLLANFNPADLRRKYDEEIKNSSGKKEQQQLEQERERWQSLLFHLGRGLILLDITTPDKEVKSQNRILKECNNGAYLQGIQENLLREFGNGNTEDEELIRKIEEEAQLYYQALWSSLSVEEQFIILELADDGIVNAKNREVFEGLVRKGIIITAGDSPVIMNKSFRNFVLTVAEPENLKEKIKELARGSDEDVTWSTIQWPIIIFLLAFLTFLFATQKEFIDSTLALFTGIATAIPVINRLISSVSSLGMEFPKIPNPLKKAG